MDYTLQNQIDDSIGKVTDFSYRKIGDTPTDMKQLTPKGYVDKQISSVYSAIPLPTSSSILSISNLVAGENLASGDAVAIGSGVGYLLDSHTVNNTSNNMTGTNPNAVWYAQLFTTSPDAISIDRIDVLVESTSGTISNYLSTVSIRANNTGQPTGGDLGVTTNTVVLPSATPVLIPHYFSSPVTISPSTIYHLVIRNVGNVSNIVVLYDNTGAINNINRSTNSGSSWSLNAGNLYSSIYEINALSGLLYKTNASVMSDKVNNFIGFAQSSILSSITGAVTIDGIATVPSIISTGVTYYVSNTNGVIASVAGTISKKVGLSVTGSSLLIKNDNT